MNRIEKQEPRLFRPGVPTESLALCRQRFHEVLAECGLKFVMIDVHRSDHIGPHDFENLGIDFSFIALDVRLSVPEADRERLLFSELLGEERQDLEEAWLLFQDGQNFILDYSNELFFLFGFHFAIKNTGKHGGAPFRCRIYRGVSAGALGSGSRVAIPGYGSSG